MLTSVVPQGALTDSASFADGVTPSSSGCDVVSVADAVLLMYAAASLSAGFASAAPSLAAAR